MSYGRYKIQVVETRSQDATYWVEATSPEEAEELAERGDTIEEQYGSFEVAGRSLWASPEKNDLTPLEHVEAHVENADLDDLVIGIAEKLASEVNNRGPKGQLRFLLEQLGEAELIALLVHENK